MTDLFDFEGHTDHYAVMGNPIAHSKSPLIHAAFARATRQRMNYTAVLVEPGSLPQAVGNFQASGGKGLNITVPFKQDAWNLVDKRSVRAELAGAVNTIRMEQDGSLYGDNTDGIGLVRDLRDNHAARLTDARILLLGAGGAARGVIEPLLEENPARLTIANRTLDRAVGLAHDFKRLGELEALGFSALTGREFDLIINATSASLHGDLPPLPDGLIAGNGRCYDMMYGAAPTVFLQWAHRHGARHLHDGLGMLVEQAAEAFWLWRGVRPATAPVISELRERLNASQG